MQINNTAFNLNRDVGLSESNAKANSPEIKLPFKAEQDTVTLSPQAQIIQKTGENNQARVDANTNDSEQSEDLNKNNSVRVSSSIGQAASKLGLSEQEAIDLYKKIDALV